MKKNRLRLWFAGLLIAVFAVASAQAGQTAFDGGAHTGEGTPDAPGQTQTTTSTGATVGTITGIIGSEPTALQAFLKGETGTEYLLLQRGTDGRLNSGGAYTWMTQHGYTPGQIVQITAKPGPALGVVFPNTLILTR